MRAGVTSWQTCRVKFTRTTPMFFFPPTRWLQFSEWPKYVWFYHYDVLYFFFKEFTSGYKLELTLSMLFSANMRASPRISGGWTTTDPPFG